MRKQKEHFEELLNPSISKKNEKLDIAKQREDGVETEEGITAQHLEDVTKETKKMEKSQEKRE